MLTKSSPLDVLPRSLLKSCADVFTPAITRLANLSLHTGRFTSHFKRAQVLPLLKKPVSTARLQRTTTVSSVFVAGADLTVSDEMKVIGVVLDRRLTFDSHVRTLARACNYHLQAIRHIRHLLTTELAVTLACSLILCRLVYCNAVLHGAPTGSIQKLQRMQNTASSKHRGGRMLSHYSNIYTGYRFTSRSTTSWPC